MKRLEWLAAMFGCVLLVISFGLMLLQVWFGLVLLGVATLLLVVCAWQLWSRNAKLTAPTVREWHVWDEELPEALSQTEVDMLRKSYVRKQIDPIDKQFYTTAREALGELPRQRPDGEQ